jgi:hypothetical protein
MTRSPDPVGRLCFLLRVVHKECRYLKQTDMRLFAPGLSLADVEQLENTPDRAERFGWLAVEPWLSMRYLRNQMVHEYVDDMKILHNALVSGHVFVPQLIATAEILSGEVLRRNLCSPT